jgi:hypothetical protein
MIDEEAAHGRFAGASREIVAFFVDGRLVRSRDPVSGCRAPSTFS